MAFLLGQSLPLPPTPEELAEVESLAKEFVEAGHEPSNLSWAFHEEYAPAIRKLCGFRDRGDGLWLELPSYVESEADKWIDRLKQLYDRFWETVDELVEGE